MLHSKAMSIVYESTDRISTSEGLSAYNDTADLIMRSLKWVFSIKCTSVCSINMALDYLYTQTVQYTWLEESLLSLSLWIPFSFSQECSLAEVSVFFYYQPIIPILQINIMLKLMHKNLVKGEFNYESAVALHFSCLDTFQDDSTMKKLHLPSCCRGSSLLVPLYFFPPENSDFILFQLPQYQIRKMSLFHPPLEQVTVKSTKKKPTLTRRPGVSAKLFLWYFPLPTKQKPHHLSIPIFFLIYF